jgi:hypothetical protein
MVHHERREWEAVAAVLALSVAYALVSGALRLGPVWLLPLLVVALLVLVMFARRAGRVRLTRGLALTLLGLATVAVVGSLGILIARLLRGGLPATDLLRDGALLWVGNMIVFALWYWEVDGGGPARRHRDGYRPGDFLFPQFAAGGDLARGWHPHFVDYLFVAFTASTAFSPTDTLPLSGRAKMLMMAQALLSMVALAVVVARAINTLR